jgi:hypothetical protein
MCLIFIKKKNADLINREWCKDVWSRNNDGWGLAYNKPSTGHMSVKAGLTFDGFWDTFSSLQRLNIDIVAHMRMATQGEVSLKTTHPFCVSERHNIWFMHNGVTSYPEGEFVQDSLDDFISMENLEDDNYSMTYREFWEKETLKPYGGSYYTGPSDTQLLVERLLTPMLDNMSNPSDFIRSEGFAFMMKEIGGTNKYTFHDNRGHVILDAGDWSETTTGIPVSNTYAFSLDKKGVMGYLGRKVG